MNPDFIFFLAVVIAVFVIFAVPARLLLPILLRHFSGAGGWRRLARAYATTRPLPAHLFRRQSVVIGHVLYRNCMIVGYDGGGLYLQFGFPLSMLGQPRLFVGWNEIKRIEGGRLFWRPAALLSIGEPLIGTMTLPMRLFEAIQPAMGLTTKSSAQPAAASLREPLT